MITVTGKLQDALAVASSIGKKLTALCFTCNGSVRRQNGTVSTAVLGRGTGQWASRTFDGLGKKLGQLIATNDKGTRIFVLSRPSLGFDLVAIKTKEAWHSKATLFDITVGLKQLVATADQMGWEGIVLPIIGTGSGQLSKTDVLPIMEELLDDRFIVVEPDNTQHTNVVEF
jgi:hypothetical protein